MHKLVHGFVLLRGSEIRRRVGSCRTHNLPSSDDKVESEFASSARNSHQPVPPLALHVHGSYASTVEYGLPEDRPTTSGDSYGRTKHSHYPTYPGHVHTHVVDSEFALRINIGMTGVTSSPLPQDESPPIDNSTRRPSFPSIPLNGLRFPFKPTETLERTDTVCNYFFGTSRDPDITVWQTLSYSHFTWAWHAVIMGTGITSALITNFPYGSGSAPVQWIGFGFFVLNLILFVFVCGCTIARYVMFPEVCIRFTEPVSRLIPFRFGH